MGATMEPMRSRIRLMGAKTNGIRIISATAKHADLVAPLFDAYRQFYKKPSNLKAARVFLRQRLVRDESVLFLAYFGSGPKSKPVGLVHLYPTYSSLSLRPQLILSDLFVIPEARRKGVGEALMNRALNLARDSGADSLLLETATDNSTAQRLYERLGYKRDSAFYRYALTICKSAK